MQRPEPHEYDSYYDTYIRLVESNDGLKALKDIHADTQVFLKTIPEEKGDYAYAKGKWTVKELLLHLCDTERVFQYRALSFSRNDSNFLPGFDHDIWVRESFAEERTIASIAEEYAVIRQSSLALFEGMNREQWTRSGMGNGVEMSVRAAAYVMAGHELHHLHILKERYL